MLVQAEQILLLIHAGAASIFLLQSQLSLATYRMWQPFNHVTFCVTYKLDLNHGQVPNLVKPGRAHC